ncbi:MAG: type II toxin-antitoxin system HicB family antitoxin [Halobacteriales archaeon]|nr:type II toxin-antitoxin system HicB family antitoxin [Halobacteriales archaeon]
MKFTVVVDPQPEGGFTGQCLEIPGVVAQGRTAEEAMANVEQAIALALELSDL